MSELFVRVFRSLIAIVVCAWPIELYFVLRHVASPDGFWQELLLAGFGIWVLGGLQLGFLIIAVVWLLLVWED